MNRIIAFYRLNVAGKSEAGYTLFAAVILILIGVAFAVFDVVAFVLGELNMNKHMPFILPMALCGIGGLLVYSLKFSPRQLEEYGRRYPCDRNK